MHPEPLFARNGHHSIIRTTLSMIARFRVWLDWDDKIMRPRVHRETYIPPTFD